MHRPVAIRKAAGIHFLQPVLPNRWQGETDCIVGPFSSCEIAEYFANRVVDFGQFESCSQRIFPKGNEWYIEVGELRLEEQRVVA